MPEQIVVTDADDYSKTANVDPDYGLAVDVKRATGGTGASSQEIQGPAADGAAAVGKPVRVAGKDGSGNVQDLLTGSDGSLAVGGLAADGATASGNPLQIAGKDAAGNVQAILTDTDGRVITTHGKTLKSKTGSASATFTLVAAVASKKLKVYSISLMTQATTAVTVTMKSAAAGTPLATYVLQAISGTVQGIATSVEVPSSLFETVAGELLEMSFSAAQTVVYNIRYWDDDAT